MALKRKTKRILGSAVGAGLGSAVGEHYGHGTIGAASGAALGALATNPKRPPKQWMRRCVAGVEAGGSAAEPGAVCGAQWYHKMSRGQKKAALKKERAGNPMAENWMRFSNPFFGR